jgi:hypothetical protein
VLTLEIINQLAERREIEPTFIVTYKNKLNRIFHSITKNFVKASDFLLAACKVYHKQWKRLINFLKSLQLKNMVVKSLVCENHVPCD